MPRDFHPLASVLPEATLAEMLENVKTVVQKPLAAPGVARRVPEAYCGAQYAPGRGRSMHIVIVGGGTAGWMAATLFAAAWPREQGADHAGRVARRRHHRGRRGFHAAAAQVLRGPAHPEQEWMPRCNATYKLNIRFQGWSTKPGCASYSHPFPSQLDAHTSRAFYVNCLTRRLGLDVETSPMLSTSTPSWRLRARGRGPRRNFPFELQHGYHFDSGLLGAFLREKACAMGVVHRQALVERVEQHENGDIRALHTREGRSHRAATSSSTARASCRCSRRKPWVSASSRSRETCSTTARWSHRRRTPHRTVRKPARWR